MTSLSDRTTTVGGLVLMMSALAAVVILALQRIVDGATTVAVIMGVLGLGGGTAIARGAVTAVAASQNGAPTETR